jgi:hypothetical protein
VIGGSLCLESPDIEVFVSVQTGSGSRSLYKVSTAELPIFGGLFGGNGASHDFSSAKAHSKKGATGSFPLVVSGCSSIH